MSCSHTTTISSSLAQYLWNWKRYGPFVLVNIYQLCWSFWVYPVVIFCKFLSNSPNGSRNILQTDITFWQQGTIKLCLDQRKSKWVWLILLKCCILRANVQSAFQQGFCCWFCLPPRVHLPNGKPYFSSKSETSLQILKIKKAGANLKEMLWFVANYEQLCCWFTSVIKPLSPLWLCVHWVILGGKPDV